MIIKRERQIWKPFPMEQMSVPIKNKTCHFIACKKHVTKQTHIFCKFLDVHPITLIEQMQTVVFDLAQLFPTALQNEQVLFWI